MQRKKILFGITKATWGGAQRYVFDLAVNLKDDFEVSVMAGEAGELKERLRSETIRFIAIEGLERKIKFFGEIGAFWRIAKIIRREKPDILHLNSPKMAGLGACLGRLLGVPKIIVTVHGWSFLENRPLAARILIFGFSWLTSLLAHKTILIHSRDFRIAEKLLPAGKISLARNGIAEFQPLTRQEARSVLQGALTRSAARYFKTLREPLWIGAIAELIPNKNIPMLMRAVAQLNQKIPVIIVGTGKLNQDLKDMARVLRVEDRVFFAGFLPDARRLIPAFDIFTLTSDKEGLPYVLLEAGLASAAVIATDVGGIPDIIDHDRTGILVKKNDASSLAEALRTLIADPYKRHRLGEALNQKVKHGFTLRTMIEETKKIYL